VADRYASFLGLSTLLDNVVVHTPRSHRRVHAAEHFFIIAHQTSELWLKQALMDIAEAVDAVALPQRDIEQAAHHTARAAEVVRLLNAHVAAFRFLHPRDFAAFRVVLGDGSGAESDQFARLRCELGLGDTPSPLYQEFTAAVEQEGTSLEQIYRQARGPLHELAEAMTELSLATWHWQLTHMETVSRVIGWVPGTGGTSGVDYLASRLAMPFPDLWKARSGPHESHRYRP
jgi:tryptophan 2,3-dioxygenase